MFRINSSRDKDVLASHILNNDFVSIFFTWFLVLLSDIGTPFS